MKLPSHLAKSRHGVYYFRFSYRIGLTVKEKRISLQTKKPQEAKAKAMQLSAIMLHRKHNHSLAMQPEDKDKASSLPLTPEDWLDTLTHNPSALRGTRILESIMEKVDKDQLAELTGIPMDRLLANEISPPVHKMDVALPNGIVFRDVQNDEDAARMVQIIKGLNLSTDQWTQLLAGKEPVYKPQEAISAPKTIPHSPAEMAGTTVQEMVQRFATRKKGHLAPKTFYEYSNYHRKFVEWLETRKNSKHIPIRTIDRQDIADFIDDLLATGLKGRTIQQKYLGAINGLFVLAQTSGALPQGQLVTYGHKIFTKTDFKKASIKSGHKSFTDEELELIFKPENLCKVDRPADFWLPLLGLFTGGRISELCQLDITDIQQHGDIWAISINDEGDKSLKTIASNRLIPIHPVLLEIGFLDYVADAKEFGTKLFPYLTPDMFGSYGATPSERWGDYLDSLGITDTQKNFHSFRSTSNNRLKQNGVAEESRCQFIGHEHDTINSSTYSDPHNLDYLLKYVASKLIYPTIDFDKLRYASGQFKPLLAKLCKGKARRDAHNAAKKAREAKMAKKVIR